MRLPSNAEIDQAAKELLAEGGFQDDLLEDKLNSSDAVLELAQYALRPVVENPKDIPPQEEILALLKMAILTFFRLGVLAGAAMPRDGQEQP